MDAFRVHELAISGRHYIMLPKLNTIQVNALARRLSKNGFLIRRSNVLTATSPHCVIHVDPRGFCWSVFDPGDEVLPVIPDLLSVSKETRPVEELSGLYYMVAKSKGKTVLRLSPRVESMTLWKALRASGECGLTPDEHAVVAFLMEKTNGECMAFTDYPTDGSTPRIYGKRRYYDSSLVPSEVESTLRSVGQRAYRNSYVPRNGAIMLDSFLLPSRDELIHLFGDLGEWCYFEPV